MKKILSVILALILTFGICVIGASAVEIEEPVYNFSYKSGDVVNLSSFYNEIKPYRQLGIPVHMSIDLNADSIEPISAGKKDGYYVGVKVQRCAESITFGGTGPIIVAVENAFSGNLISELYIPGNVYSFEDDLYDLALAESRRTGEPLKSSYAEYMFYDCQKLETVTIDNPSDIIFCWAFCNCTGLKNVVFTDKVTAICTSMFENCTSLESIDIPPSINKICDCAFYNTGLNSIYIPSSVKVIEPYALGYQGSYDKIGYIGDTSSYMITQHPEMYEISKVDGFKIYGESGSEAERYAIENGFEFIDTSEQAEEKVNSVSITKQAALGGIAEIAVNVSAGADKVQFINSDGQTITYTRGNVNVKSIESISAASETWTVNLKVYKPSEIYKVKAKFGKKWTDDSIQLTLNELILYENKVYSAKTDIPALKGKYAKVKLTVGGSPSKIQFRNSSGNTITYSRDNLNIVSISADNSNHTETWTLKLKVYKSAENYTVAAKYNTGWSDVTASFTLNELVKSSADITFNIVIHSEDYSSDDVLYINTLSGTKRIVSGNVYEEEIGREITREWVKSYNTGDDYDPAIYNSGNGREKWELPGGTFFRFLNYSGELAYISAEMADGSWTVKGYYGSERYNGLRYEPYVTMAETESVKKINSADVTEQSMVSGYADVQINASSGASKLQIKNGSGSTITYTRSSESVKSIEKSGTNEIWTISLKVYRLTDTYTVKAKYGDAWTTDDDVQFVVIAQ